MITVLYRSISLRILYLTEATVIILVRFLYSIDFWGSTSATTELLAVEKILFCNFNLSLVHLTRGGQR